MSTKIVFKFDPQAYGPVFAALLDGNRRRPLGAGEPDSTARGALKQLTIDSAFAHARVIDQEIAACCLSGVWLLHDYLDDSHKISQEIDTTSGSFWHGIMHRREGDFWNSKYWFRRVGQHPAFATIAERAQREWDPFAFVDQCQAALAGKSNEQDLCLDLQQTEWECLFDHCYHAAIGK